MRESRRASALCRISKRSDARKDVATCRKLGGKLDADLVRLLEEGSN